MLLIFSSSADASTDCVLDWIYFRNPNENIKRINDIIDIQKTHYGISDDDEIVRIEDSRVNLDTELVTACWYRRGALILESNVTNSLYLSNLFYYTSDIKCITYRIYINSRDK